MIRKYWPLLILDPILPLTSQPALPQNNLEVGGKRYFIITNILSNVTDKNQQISQPVNFVQRLQRVLSIISTGQNVWTILALVTDIAIPLTNNRKIAVSMTTALGKQQKYKLAFP